MNCKFCQYMKEYYRYKTRRKDGNDCIERLCEHHEILQRMIDTYRPFGGLRTGKDAMVKTSPRWCPLIKKDGE